MAAVIYKKEMTSSDHMFRSSDFACMYIEIEQEKLVCLLHDFAATLRLSALPSALYFILSKLAV